MKQWFAYNHVAKIALIERTGRKKTCNLGAFFESWNAAHDHIMEQAQSRLLAARRQLDAAQGHFGNCKGMKAPDDPSSATGGVAK